jgi:hypothetical protein
MTRRRITAPNVPFVGGRPERFTCVYVIAQEGNDGPSRICYGNDPSDRKRRIQTYHWLPLAIHARFWVGDMHLARRIESECACALGNYHLRGGWYAISPKTAQDKISEGAGRLRIPILSDAEYRKLFPTEDQSDEMILRQSGATTGGLKAA